MRMRFCKIPTLFKIKMPLLELFGDEVDKKELNDDEVNCESSDDASPNTNNKSKVSSFDNLDRREFLVEAST